MFVFGLTGVVSTILLFAIHSRLMQASEEEFHVSPIFLIIEKE